MVYINTVFTFSHMRLCLLIFIDVLLDGETGGGRVPKNPLPALLCSVDVKDGSAQFVLLYTFLRIFTFSFYTHNVCIIYIRQRTLLDIGHRCTNLLQDTLSTDPEWPVEILRNTEVNKGRLNNPRRRKKTPRATSWNP